MNINRSGVGDAIYTKKMDVSALVPVSSLVTHFGALFACYQRLMFYIYILLFFHKQAFIEVLLINRWKIALYCSYPQHAASPLLQMLLEPSQFKTIYPFQSIQNLHHLTL